MRVIPVGIIYFILYYAIFTFMIKKFNFKTPGREDDDAETKLYTKADVNARKEGNQTTSVMWIAVRQDFVLQSKMQEK